MTKPNARNNTRTSTWFGPEQRAPSNGGSGPAGRPVILCLGDATTEFGTHLINQPTAEVGSGKHKASLSVTIDPVATEARSSSKSTWLYT